MNEFVLARILPAAGQGIVALVAAFALTRIFRKLPADSQAWIWRLAIGRFLLALVWEWPVSVLPRLAASTPDAPVHSSHILMPPGGSTAQVLTDASLARAIDQPRDANLVTVPALDWTPLTWLWAVGTVIVLGFGLFRWLQLYRLARRGHVVSPQIRISDEAAVPFLVGNVIVLPSQMPVESREVALAHETAHRIRRDPLYSLPNFVASALFWFVLPVWLALREYAIQVEIDCDRRALRLAGVSPRHYGSMLVALATGSIPPVGASAMAGGSTALSRRLKAMKNQQNPRTLATIALTLAVGALVLIPVRPVAATLPPVQSAEVKQSQAKVERAQRDLNRALAELSRAVNRTAKKNEVYVWDVRAKAYHGPATSRPGKLLATPPVALLPGAPAVAPLQSDIQSRMIEVDRMTQRLDHKQELMREQSLVNLQAAKKERILVGDDAAATMKAANRMELERRIQILEQELKRLRRDISPEGGIPPIGAMPGADQANLALRDEDVALQEKIRLRDETVTVAQAAKMDVLQEAKAAAGPIGAAGIGYAPAITGEGGPAVAADVMREAVAADAPAARAERIVDRVTVKDAMMMDKAARVSGVAQAPRKLQIAAGKNGTITIIENGKSRTLRVNPKTHTVIVDGFTIYMDGKKTPDGALIIRVTGR